MFKRAAGRRKERKKEGKKDRKKERKKERRKERKMMGEDRKVERRREIELASFGGAAETLHDGELLSGQTVDRMRFCSVLSL